MSLVHSPYNYVKRVELPCFSCWIKLLNQILLFMLKFCTICFEGSQRWGDGRINVVHIQPNTPSPGHPVKSLQSFMKSLKKKGLSQWLLLLVLMEMVVNGVFTQKIVFSNSSRLKTQIFIRLNNYYKYCIIILIFL